MSSTSQLANDQNSVADRNRAAALRKMARKPNPKFAQINQIMHPPMGSLLGARYTKNNRKATPGRDFVMIDVKKPVEVHYKQAAIPARMLLETTGGQKKFFRQL